MQEVKKKAIIKKLEAGLGNSHVGIEVSLWDVDTTKFREGDTVEVQIRRLKRPMAKERERRVVKMPKPKPRYEIKEEGPLFVGYVSGFPCVLASKREIVERMLAERFLGDVEKGEIVPFPKIGRCGAESSPR
ncbi:MAG TPA: hypothetical protein VMD53_18755 [Rhizomicrobium sp.]|nr:hypothetical protein [Rhizomicrobium sp.]